MGNSAHPVMDQGEKEGAKRGSEPPSTAGGIMQSSLLTTQRRSPLGLQPRRRAAEADESQLGLFGLGDGGALLLPNLPEPLEPEAITPAAVVPVPHNYRITAADRLGQGGLRQKAEDNLRAIRLLRVLQVEGRPATPEE
jgi:hypothetical protein